MTKVRAFREPVVLEKRKPLTRAEVIHLSVQQLGRCACGCGKPLDAIREGVIDEHRVALALGGTNALSNRELYRKSCAKAKTAERDAPAIAKAQRIEAREDGSRRPRQKIQSRGFSKTQSRGFDGQVRPRSRAQREDQNP